MIQTKNITVPLDGFTIINGSLVMNSMNTSQTELRAEYHVSDTGRFELLNLTTTERMGFKENRRKGSSQFGTGRMLYLGSNIDFADALTSISYSRVKKLCIGEVNGSAKENNQD